MEGYGIDPSKIQIFEIEDEPDMNYIQEYMGKLSGGTTVPRVFIDGKFVIIHLKSNLPLHFAEVEVFGQGKMQ